MKLLTWHLLINTPPIQMEIESYSLIVYCIPALITGVIAYLFFKEYTNNETKRRHYSLHKSLQKEVLPDLFRCIRNIQCNFPINIGIERLQL